jgi:carboxyl-terminal processing protease
VTTRRRSALITLCLVGTLAVACTLSVLCAVGAAALRWVDQANSAQERADRHLRIFTELWQVVHDEYLYANYNGADWEAVGQEYRVRVEDGLSDETFWFTMDEMLLELQDDHSLFLSPDGAVEEDRIFSGELDYVGVGVSAMPLPEKGYAVILLVLPGSPAARAGLRPHDHILAVDGVPVCCDADGYDNLYLLLGSEGSTVELRVRTPGEPSRTVTLARARILELLPVEARWLEGGVGYLLIPTFWDETVADRVRQALEGLAAEGELIGLILDLRINPGGSEVALQGLLELFADGELGRFVSRRGSDALRVEGVDVGGSQHVPLVILVGRETVSFAEVFAGVLQEAGRARIVGRTTRGNVEITYGYDFEDGSRAWIAQEMFRPPSGTNWEETGIAPDLEIPLDWDEFTVEDDPQLEAALDLLR